MPAFSQEAQQAVKLLRESVPTLNTWTSFSDWWKEERKAIKGTPLYDAGKFLQRKGLQLSADKRNDSWARRWNDADDEKTTTTSSSPAKRGREDPLTTSNDDVTSAHHKKPRHEGGERSHLNHSRYHSTVQKSAIGLQLPLVIEMQCDRHRKMPGVRITAVLWYADEWSTDATCGKQRDSDYETFHFRKDYDGIEQRKKASSRSAYFHQVVHVECLETGHAGHPAVLLVGKWFSSFHTVPRCLDMMMSGWDRWKIAGSTVTMRDFVFKRRGQFVNDSSLVEPVDYYPIIIGRITGNPRVVPRDQLILLCREECNLEECDPGKECKHGVVHDDVQEEPSEKEKEKDKEIYLRRQLRPTGRRLAFDGQDVVQGTTMCNNLLHQPLFTRSLMNNLVEVQQFYFPNSFPMRQVHDNSFNDYLLLDDMQAVKDFGFYFSIGITHGGQLSACVDDKGDIVYFDCTLRDPMAHGTLINKKWVCGAHGLPFNRVEGQRVPIRRELILAICKEAVDPPPTQQSLDQAFIDSEKALLAAYKLPVPVPAGVSEWHVKHAEEAFATARLAREPAEYTVIPTSSSPGMEDMEVIWLADTVLTLQSYGTEREVDEDFAEYMMSEKQHARRVMKHTKQLMDARRLLLSKLRGSKVRYEATIAIAAAKVEYY